LVARFPGRLGKFQPNEISRLESGEGFAVPVAKGPAMSVPSPADDGQADRGAKASAGGPRAGLPLLLSLAMAQFMAVPDS
jgi:hypothetical protein